MTTRTTKPHINLIPKMFKKMFFEQSPNKKKKKKKKKNGDL